LHFAPTSRVLDHLRPAVIVKSTRPAAFVLGDTMPLSAVIPAWMLPHGSVL